MKKIILLALAAGLAAAPRASAQSNATLVPSVSIGTIHDDNLFAKEHGEAGTMTLVRPGLEANYESPTLNFQSLFSFDMQHSNFDALSTLDARRHADMDLKHRTTAAATLGLGFRYDRTETPGELNLDTGILGERRIAERFEIVPSIAYRSTPRTTHSPRVIWFFTMPLLRSYRYRWFQPSRSDIQMISPVSGTSCR